MLFKAAAETLRTIAADPRHLGAETGLVAVLHSWGQTLTYHPHLHCIVPGGGVSPDVTRWISCRPGFFLPVRVLSRLCRRRFLEELRVAHDTGRLGFFGDLVHLAKPDAFARMLAEVGRLEWVVYAKPPSGGPEQVLAYLGRYSHRVAIANSRLISMNDDRVAFRWRDYRHSSKTKVVTLDAHEFIRRCTRCRTASIASATTASSPMVIAPPGSNCAAGCRPDRGRTLSNRMPKASPSPPRVKAKVPNGHWKIMTFLAALRQDRVDAPWLIDGPINGERTSCGMRFGAHVSGAFDMLNRVKDSLRYPSRSATTYCAKGIERSPATAG